MMPSIHPPAGKLFPREEIIARFHDGQTIAVGGQACVGSPDRLIECVIDSGAKNLRLISLDSGHENRGVGRLIHEGRVSSMIVSHIGMNHESVEKAESGELRIEEFCPLGSLIERLRCGGAGLGGVLSPTGVGTEVEKHKQKVIVNGVPYLLEPALRADISLVRARRADPVGNLSYHGTAMTSNPVIASCGDLCLVDADFLVKTNEMSIDAFRTPSVFVDMILEADQ